MGDSVRSKKKNILTAMKIVMGSDKKTKDMEKFLDKFSRAKYYKFSSTVVKKRISILAKFLANRKNILITTRNKSFENSIRKFAEVINAKYYVGRFLPGTLTNPNVPNYYEADVLFVIDPKLDKRAIKEASKANVVTVAICNSDDLIKNLDFVLPANNKKKSSVAAILYILAKLICRNRNLEANFKIKDFL